MASKIDEFYTSLQTLPRLISDLALSVAQAQTRLDENYVKELAAFTSIILPLLKDSPGKVDEYINLFKTIAPSRYQFTETIVEVRADLQMTSGTSIAAAANVGITTPVFAVAVNASYSRRSAEDYRAAALVRTQLNAIPSNQDVISKLLDPKGTPGTQLPDAERYKAIGDLISQLPQTPKLPSGSPPSKP